MLDSMAQQRQWSAIRWKLAVGEGVTAADSEDISRISLHLTKVIYMTAVELKVNFDDVYLFFSNVHVGQAKLEVN